MPTGRSRRTRFAALSLATGLIGASGALAGDLPALIGAVAAAARTPVPLRADGRLESPDVPARDVLLLAHRDAVYVEVRDGERALVRPGKAVVRRGARLVRVPPGTALAGSDLRLEDLAPFSRRLLALPQVSDEGPQGVVVTSAPGLPSAYSLLVVTLDPDEHRVLKTKCYEETITNLVKMLRAEDAAAMGGRWRARAVVVDGFRPSRTTRLATPWREAPDALVGLATLRGPALLPPPAP